MKNENKLKKTPALPKQTYASLKVHEPLSGNNQIPFRSAGKDMDYKEFKKIAHNVPFTQKEWSNILHISERTLQRYSKDNTVFSFSVADRILQIDKVIKRGVHVFGSMDKFMNWIRDKPHMPEGRLSFYSLASIEGIQKVLTQLGRIEHGILA